MTSLKLSPSFRVARSCSTYCGSSQKPSGKIGTDGVDAVAVLPLEVVAVHPVLGLEVTDDRLDRAPSFHLAFDDGGGSFDLAGDKDAKPVQVVVAAIASTWMRRTSRPVFFSMSLTAGLSVWPSKGLP